MPATANRHAKPRTRRRRVASSQIPSGHRKSFAATTEAIAIAGVQSREDAGLAVGGDAGDLLEAGLPRQAHHEVAPLGHPPPLGGDRRLPHPFLEARDALSMALDDLRLDRVEAVVGPQDLWKSERGRGGGKRRQRMTRRRSRPLARAHRDRDR